MTAANPSHALALVLVDELARGGVTDAVLAPGSRSTALAMALHDEPRIRLHVQIDERSAAYTALGLGRATARPAVVVCTSGTAGVNLHPAVVEAHESGVPMLVLTADRPPELRHTGANQTIDQLKLYGDAVRWFVEVGVPEDRADAVPYWRATASRLLAQARGLASRPGPVHANLAFREPTVPARDDGRTSVAHEFRQSLDGRPDGRPWATVHADRGVPSADQVAAFAAILGAARRGVLLLGDTAGDVGPALALARAARWPVIAEPLSNGRTGAPALAHAPLLAGDPAFAAAHQPDLVVRIGRTGLSRPVTRLAGEHVPQVLVDRDGAWHDPERAVADLVVADPAALCAATLDAVVPADDGWLEGWRAADRAAADAVATVLDAEDAPTEPRTARDLAAGLPDGTTLVVASSMPVRDLDQMMAPRVGLRLLGNRGASGIDGFVSTALGVALAGDPTVALAGDLSLLHDRNGFLLRPDGAVDLTIVVVNNDGGGIFSFLPQARWTDSFERVFGTPHGVAPADEAATHGLGHELVERAVDLLPAVERAREAGGIRLVEVRTRRDANLALHRRLQEAVGAAIG